MFDRMGIKEESKRMVNAAIKNAILVGLIIVVVSLLGNITRDQTYFLSDGSSYTVKSTTPFSFVFALLIGNTAFAVSKAKVFSNFVAYGDLNFNDFAFGFKNYGRNFVAMFLQNLFIALWTVVFIVPGIIKAISWSLVPYILADNPDIKPMDAIRLSGVMTYGFKMDIFVFVLSFLGWFLLTGITLGVAGLYVMPYFETSFAKLYSLLKDKAVAEGRVPADMFSSSAVYAVSEPLN